MLQPEHAGSTLTSLSTDKAHARKMDARRLVLRVYESQTLKSGFLIGLHLGNGQEIEDATQ